jgi:hypothetical protein
VMADHTSSGGCPTHLENVRVACSPSYSTLPTGETWLRGLDTLSVTSTFGRGTLLVEMALKRVEAV